MIFKTKYQVNYTVIPAGSEVTILRQAKDTMFGSNRFLMRVTTGPEAGFEWWDFANNLQYPFGWYKKVPIHKVIGFADDYIEAGWTVERMIRAGLVFKQCREVFPQYVKYYQKLKTAEAL
jgi:hypothetical protein